jgi:hypothetical protein
MQVELFSDVERKWGIDDTMEVDGKERAHDILIYCPVAVSTYPDLWENTYFM